MITWFTKFKQKSMTDTVSVCRYETYYRITISADVMRQLNWQHGDLIQIGFEISANAGKRMVFRKTTNDDGYNLTQNGQSGTLQSIRNKLDPIFPANWNGRPTAIPYKIEIEKTADQSQILSADISGVKNNG